jgi:hypothetical protein
MLLKTKDRVFYPAMLLIEKGLRGVQCQKLVTDRTARREEGHGGSSLGLAAYFDQLAEVFDPSVFEKKEFFFWLPWNVVDSKGPEMRKVGRMRLPWNVYESKRLI